VKNLGNVLSKVGAFEKALAATSAREKNAEKNVAAKLAAKLAEEEAIWQEAVLCIVQYDSAGFNAQWHPAASVGMTRAEFDSALIQQQKKAAHKEKAQAQAAKLAEQERQHRASSEQERQHSVGYDSHDDDCHCPHCVDDCHGC
jgi:hypothetical protein